MVQSQAGLAACATLLQPTMSSAATTGDDADANTFKHQLAIKLSRALNLVNPNDLLAQRVTDIATTNTLEGFIKGECRFLIAEVRVN